MSPEDPSLGVATTGVMPLDMTGGVLAAPLPDEADDDFPIPERESGTEWLGWRVFDAEPPPRRVAIAFVRDIPDPGQGVDGMPVDNPRTHATLIDSSKHALRVSSWPPHHGVPPGDPRDSGVEWFSGGITAIWWRLHFKTCRDSAAFYIVVFDENAVGTPYQRDVPHPQPETIRISLQVAHQPPVTLRLYRLVGAAAYSMPAHSQLYRSPWLRLTTSTQDILAPKTPVPPMSRLPHQDKPGEDEVQASAARMYLSSAAFPVDGEPPQLFAAGLGDNVIATYDPKAGGIGKVTHRASVGLAQSAAADPKEVTIRVPLRVYLFAMASVGRLRGAGRIESGQVFSTEFNDIVRPSGIARVHRDIVEYSLERDRETLEWRFTIKKVLDRDREHRPKNDQADGAVVVVSSRRSYTRVDDARIDVARANELYSPTGVQFDPVFVTSDFIGPRDESQVDPAEGYPLPAWFLPWIVSGDPSADFWCDRTSDYPNYHRVGTLVHCRSLLREGDERYDYEWWPARDNRSIRVFYVERFAHFWTSKAGERHVTEPWGLARRGSSNTAPNCLMVAGVRTHQPNVLSHELMHLLGRTGHIKHPYFLCQDEEDLGHLSPQAVEATRVLPFMYRSPARNDSIDWRVNKWDSTWADMTKRVRDSARWILE